MLKNNNYLNNIIIFLIPVMFSFVDLVIRLPYINLRIDDLLIYIFLFLNVLNIVRFKYNNILFIQIVFFIIAIISLSITLVVDKNILSKYEIIRSLGSFPYIIVLPYILFEKNRRNIFYYGSLVGSIIFACFVYNNYFSIINLQDVTKYSNIKEEVTFSTINPNTVATIALIFGWICILYYSESKKYIGVLFGLILFIIPIIIFARASTIGLVISFIYIVIFSKKKERKLFQIKPIILIVILIIIASKIVNKNVLLSAYRFSIFTGEGTSNRTALWRQGIELIKMSPILGHGFGTENNLYIKYFNGHMSHEIFLHYWIELGIFGIVLFLYLLARFYYEKVKILKIEYNVFVNIQIAAFTSFLIADLAGQLLYFNKYAYIIISITAFLPIKNRENMKG